MAQKSILVFIGLLVFAICQFSDDFSRNIMYPLAVGAFDNHPDICLKNTLPDGILKRKVGVPCDPVNDTCSGYTASSDKNKAIIIGFSGSIGQEGPYEIVDIIFSKQAQFPGGGLVAKFFYETFLAIWGNGMKDDFLTLRQQYPDYDVWITGASLGAALGVVTAGYLTQNGLVPSNQVRVWTYGEPRVGDTTFAAQMNDKVPFAYRIVHNDDIIPRLPLHIENYEHHRTEIFYPNNMTLGDPFVVCRGNEDESCSAGIPLYKFGLVAHTTYYNIDIGVFQHQGCVYT